MLIHSPATLITHLLPSDSGGSVAVLGGNFYFNACLIVTRLQRGRAWILVHMGSIGGLSCVSDAVLSGISDGSEIIFRGIVKPLHSSEHPDSV